MTTTKPAETRITTGRAKQTAAAPDKTDRPVAEKSTVDGSAAVDPVPDDRNPMLDQLVALTRSIGDLVQQNAGHLGQTATTTDITAGTELDDTERARVVFAYDFLGAVLGRHAPSVFQLKRVTVTRNPGTLTFTGLDGATAAKVRAADNTVRLLEGLSEGVPVRIDYDPDAIADNVRIDSIVTFTVAGGKPVAIGPCRGPVGDVVG